MDWGSIKDTIFRYINLHALRDGVESDIMAEVGSWKLEIRDSNLEEVGSWILEVAHSAAHVAAYFVAAA
mgnify:CR=1 FL=1